MTDTQVTSFERLSTSQIMEMIGQEGVQTNTGFPRLTINRQPEDDEGNKLPVGTYAVYNSETESMVYGKPAIFRPFMNSFQFMEYNSEQGKFSNRSVIFKNWKDDPIDISGGSRCGKVAFKDRDKLSKSELEQQKSIKCYRLVYGTVSIDGINPKGEKVEVVHKPVLWRVTGSNFVPVGDAMQSLKNRKKLMFNHTLSLDTERRKAGSNVFYVSTIKVNQDEVTFTKEDMELMTRFQDTITTENEEVVGLWKEANKTKISGDDIKVKEVIAEIDGSPFEVKTA
jgi:hypothetical protein